jgi:hypothetical protein
VKHAGDATLDQLETSLALLRKIPGLVERKRGVFYRKSRAFLHFHEDPAGIFADLRIGDAWQRIEIMSAAARRALIRLVRNTADTEQ